MNFWNYKCRVLVCAALVMFSGYTSALPLDLSPDMQLVSKKGPVVGDNQVLLTAPKRVNNALRIEKDILVQGERSDYLLSIGGLSDSYKAFLYFRDLMKASGEIQFLCEQRACGSSNYWANTILKERKLYGRDSDQYYLAGTLLLDGKLQWVTVYAVRNGRKQHFVHLSVIESAVSSWSNGKLVEGVKLSKEDADYIRGYLDENDGHQVWLAGFVNTPEGGSLKSQQKKVDAALLEYKKLFVRENDLHEKRVKIYSGGPFSTNQIEMNKIAFRVYLLAP